MAGGIALDLVNAAKTGIRKDFCYKGRFKDLMERIAIHIITTRAALVGGAAFCRA
jgi:glucokinase